MVSRVLIGLKYNFNANTVYFDGIQLFKEEFGNVYDYDADGNVKSVRDIQGQKTQYEYQNNNLTKTILPTGAELTYTYDNYHNVKTATTEEGLVYNFGYDAYGNNTSVSIGSGTNAITATAAYSTDGNRLVSTTDAAGNVTTYSYNANTNMLEWVKYPEDTDTTKTTYTYDSMYRMASAAASYMSAQYTYTDDNLTRLQTPSTAYTFTYGAFDVRTSVKAGDYTLATYTYTDNEDRYLSRLDYGNGDRVQYTYDDKGRVTRQTYEDGAYISYTYDNSGILTKQYDSATGRTTHYTYDTTGRLMKYTETGTNYSHSVTYDYDPSNNLSSLTETTNGVTNTTSYFYDDDNRVTSVTSGGVTKYYTYDSLGRVTKQETKNGTTTILTEEFSYVAGTNQVREKEYFTPSDIYLQFFYYTYDDNGNIVSVQDEIYETRYYYDSANQLKREDNEAVEFTKTWSYDDSGNIFYRDEYDLTYGTLGDPNEIYEFWYDEVNGWGDLLQRCYTHMGNTNVNYSSDAIGNMTGDGTWTYSWKHGRQLSSMSDGSTTWTYSYDADGMRTQRTNGTDTYTYTYNGSQLTQMTKGEHTLNFTYDANGTPMTVSKNGVTYYYATNLQGDVMDILDEDGNAVASYRYDAWGKVYTAYGSLAELNPLRYRGYVYDNETELYYVGSRYYNPEIGRWISADGQISGVGGELLGHNQFAYCFNNPVNMDDPSGNWPKWLENTVKVVSVVVAVAAVVATVAAVSAFTAGTGSAAAVYGATILLGAALSGINGGIANEAKGNSYANGYAGGVVSGTTQSAASRLPGGTVWGGALGTGTGTAITMSLNNIDPDSTNSSASEIAVAAGTSALKASATSMVTASIGAGVGGIDYKTGTLYGGVADGCGGLMPELTLGFGEGIKAFFGAVDDAFVYIWE